MLIEVISGVSPEIIVAIVLLIIGIAFAWIRMAIISRRVGTLEMKIQSLQNNLADNMRPETDVCHAPEFAFVSSQDVTEPTEPKEEPIKEITEPLVDNKDEDEQEE